MRQLSMADIVSNQEYEAMRPAFRQRVINLKKLRRLAIGPRISLVFENTETMRFQVQEMMRIEHIEDVEKIREEIEVYNDLLPSGLAIGATLLIELSQTDDMPAILRQLSGVEEHVMLEIESQQIHALAEAGRSTEEKTSSVHYLTFPFTESDRILLMEHPESVALRIDHPGYRYQTKIPAETVSLLIGDLLASRE
ncbi:MAG: DUF3501 domain-containing protein [Sulfobacillus benefaciens]|uniref:DUF3501 domain-containing protein n=1 Tax=Sulfobacillus benefaciens TaxID=453960 RepID=A0A2T2XEQ6_9FIRM|nr:MAG: DUF3501 domain-containing protein [Sulfobacillus benefaciens]